MPLLISVCRPFRQSVARTSRAVGHRLLPGVDHRDDMRVAELGDRAWEAHNLGQILRLSLPSEPLWERSPTHDGARK